MKETYKRLPKEIVLLHKLHPEIKIIYVEGPFDKCFLEFFLNCSGLVDVNVEVIDNKITFSSEVLIDPELRSNKNKLEYLSILFEKSKNKDMNNIVCLVDKDIDEFIEKNIQNDFIYKTDFTCTEMYLFDLLCLNKLRLSIKKLPPDVIPLLEELKTILSEIFLVRVARFLLNRENKLKEIEKVFDVDKKNNKIIFDREKYLDDYLEEYCIKTKKKIYEDTIAEKRKLFKDDYRHQMHGHDYIGLLSSYLRKISNGTYRKNCFDFWKEFILTVEFNDLRNYGLFSNLTAKFSKN